MSDENKDGGLAAATLEVQMMQQAIGCITVKDGKVFLFSDVVLEKLLEQARSNPEKKALVFVKNGPLAEKVVV